MKGEYNKLLVPSTQYRVTPRPPNVFFALFAEVLCDLRGERLFPAFVHERYKKLGIPNYWAGINSTLTPRFGNHGQIPSVEISYPRDAMEQYLCYGSKYDSGLLKPEKKSF